MTPRTRIRRGAEPPRQAADDARGAARGHQSIVALEPRVMQLVVKGGDPYQLLILKKPLLIEEQKGGTALHRRRRRAASPAG